MDLTGQDLMVDDHIDKNPSNSAETRANYFAANFLMPEEAVISFYTDKVNVEPDGVIAKHIVMVQHYFKVSYTTMLIRMKTLGLISDSAYQKAAVYSGDINPG